MVQREDVYPAGALGILGILGFWIQSFQWKPCKTIESYKSNDFPNQLMNPVSVLFFEISLLYRYSKQCNNAVELNLIFFFSSVFFFVNGGLEHKKGPQVMSWFRRPLLELLYSHHRSQLQIVKNRSKSTLNPIKSTSHNSTLDPVKYC